MKKIRIDEKITVWQKLELAFSDDVDLSNDEKIKQALKEAPLKDIRLLCVFNETEEHLEYDIKSIEVIEE